MINCKKFNAPHIFFLFFCLQSIMLTAQTWRSSLYPENWTPMYSDSLGRFLHDFSYAGYKSGLVNIPIVTKNIVDVTKPPYNADNTGAKDATNSIQQAIDHVGQKGGGVVFLPAGEYKISISESKPQALRIKYNNVVIRGDGTTKTFIKSASTNIRYKQLINFYPDGASWYNTLDDKATLISKDLLLPTTTIPVQNASRFKKGDIVALGTDLTDAFVEEHGCTGYWKNVKALRFCREIVDVDYVKNIIEIDAPTRYYLKMRDNARIYVINPQLSECGIEDLSIGNVQHNGTGWEDLDFSIAGTGAYDVQGSHFIVIKNAINCWVRNVSTYRPAENTLDIHILSNCLKLEDSRFVSVERCNLQKTQYEGEGGNGYLYTLIGNDCLLKSCNAENGRHSYDFKEMTSSGNVLLNCRSKDPRLSSDFHMVLSMANLFDSFESDGDYIDANFRPWGGAGYKHMYSTTQSVIWNSKSIKKYEGYDNPYLIVSRQFGQGYVIGTSGVVTKVLTTPISGFEGRIAFNTGPEDFVEGVGTGERLLPQSLYLDQFKKRLQRMPLNEDFESFEINSTSNSIGRSWISNSDNSNLNVQVVDNPNKSDINKSNKVLKLNRKQNTITKIGSLEIKNTGVSTNSYNLNLNQTNSIIELKVLKNTSGKLTARIYTDVNTNTYVEVVSPYIPASTKWKLVKFNYNGKIKTDFTQNTKFEFLPNLISVQNTAAIVYIDDVMITGNN